MSDPAPKRNRAIVVALVILAAAAILSPLIGSLFSKDGRCPLCSGKGFVRFFQR